MRLSLISRLAFAAALMGSLAAPVAARAQNDRGIPIMTLRAALQLPPDRLPPVFISPNPISTTLTTFIGPTA
jgi:hypothetical protein